MRKFSVFFLIVFVLITVCLLPISAADTPEEVTLSVSIQRNEKITSGGIEFIYDKNIFEFVKGKWAVDDFLISDFDLEKSRGVFAFDGDKTIEGDIFIATLHTKDKKAINEDTTISAIVTLLNVNGEMIKENVNFNISTAKEDKPSEEESEPIAPPDSNAVTTKNEEDTQSLFISNFKTIIVCLITAFIVAVASVAMILAKKKHSKI